MAADFIPQSYKNLRDWLQKQTTIGTVAPSIGMTAAEQAAYVANVQRLLPLVTALVEYMELAEQKVADLQPLLDSTLPSLRKEIRRIKLSTGYQPSLGEDFGWIGETHEIDPANSRPVIEVEVQRGRVKITGKKPGYEAYNLYSRLKGDNGWNLLAIRKRKFPYFDEARLRNAAIPEIREYIAIGVINDEEIGHPSEIKEAVYAG